MFRLSIWIVVVMLTAAVAQLPLSIINNLPENSSINVYVTGIDASNNVVLLQADGTWYHPNPMIQSATPLQIPADIAIPVGEQGTTTTIHLPGYLSAGRIWFAVGTLTFFTVFNTHGVVTLVEPSVTNPSDPNTAVKWDFIEFTYSADDGFFANISYVDFIGLALGMLLESSDNSLQAALGLSTTAMTSICNNLRAQAVGSDQPWDQLCVTDTANNIIRVLSPNLYLKLHPASFNNYYTDYVDRVWARYGNEPLIINTQTSAGNVTCMTSGNNLICMGDNRSYSKPTTSDIFSCNSGPFIINASDNNIHQAVVPRLCAAFVRTILLLDGGDIQPNLDSALYYSTTPTNLYSKFVHANEVDGKGYAFSYDDVNPTGENQSGLVASKNPKLLTITVRGS